MAIRFGTSQPDTLTGTASTDFLFGLAGDDRLTGGGGRDFLFGGSGNDTYVIDSRDFLVELAGGGTDTVVADFAHTLGANLENLTLAGIANINGTGNAANNVIVGNAGSNVLNGGAGNDTLDGGLGGDVFGVDVLIGGAGDDRMVFDSDDVYSPDATGVRYDGGAGTDTLYFGAISGSLDLVSGTSFEALRDIEILDMSGAGNHSAFFNYQSLVNLSSTTDVVQIEGGEGDRVSTYPDRDWIFTGNVTIGDQIYAEYVADAVTLRVDLNIDRSGISVVPPPGSVSTILLEGLDITPEFGFRMNGVGAGDASGVSVASAGDINGDGFDDVVVGAPSASPGGIEDAGEAYVIFGGAGAPAPVDLAALDGANGFRIAGLDASDQLGPVAGAGDINGDGIDDLVIGVPFAGPQTGETGAAYVVFGTAAGFGSSVDLAALDGTNGFAIPGFDFDHSAGQSVAGLGDVNGDGLDDLAVAVPMEIDDAPAGTRGYTYVLYGSSSGFPAEIDLQSLDSANGFRMTDFSGLSRAVAGAGDVNGDGIDDFMISAPGASPGGRTGAGEAYVVFGTAAETSGDIDLTGLDGTNGFRLAGVDPLDFSSGSLAAAGDINGDGYGDMIVGAAGADRDGVEGAGEAYVVFGRAGGFEPTVELSALDGTNGFRILGLLGSDISGEQIGRAVSAAGDFNGDGYDDLLVSAPSNDNSTQDAGLTFVVYGRGTGFNSTVDLSTGADEALLIVGDEPFDHSGTAVAAAGDVNGDGFSDVVLGAPSATREGRVSEGESYVVFGGDYTVAVTHAGTQAPDALFGSGAADVMVSGLSDDTLQGRGGADVFRAGQGDDTIWIPDAAFRDIDGGSGIDTLRLDGGGITLDFTVLADSRISGIEKMNIAGTGDNALTLALGDVLNLSDTSNLLTVDGNVGDTVNLVGSWTDGGSAGGYHTYQQGMATVLAHDDLAVNMV